MNRFFLQFFLLAVVNVSTTCSQHDFNPSEDIIIIDVELTTRIGISKELRVINSFNPKVVAFDEYFSVSKNDYQDSLLAIELNNCNNLVMISEIQDYTGEEKKMYREIFNSDSIFLKNARLGFANVIFDDSVVLRRFSTAENVKDQTMNHFAVQVAMSFDSAKTTSILKRNSRIVNVKYLGNKEAFKVFTHDDILSNEVTKNDIEGKIVIFGYAGRYDGISDEVDKFVTPLNLDVVEGSPDMYGVVYLANIIAQILE